jgi:hypothetical protein
MIQARPCLAMRMRRKLTGFRQNLSAKSPVASPGHRKVTGRDPGVTGISPVFVPPTAFVVHRNGADRWDSAPVPPPAWRIAAASRKIGDFPSPVRGWCFGDFPGQRLCPSVVRSQRQSISAEPVTFRRPRRGGCPPSENHRPGSVTHCGLYCCVRSRRALGPSPTYAPSGRGGSREYLLASSQPSASLLRPNR